MRASDLWPRHKVPIVVTGGGLFVAFMLAVAPLTSTNTPANQASASVAQRAVSGVSSDALEALNSSIAALNSRLGSIETRLDTLDTGVVRGLSLIHISEPTRPY